MGEMLITPLGTSTKIWSSIIREALINDEPIEPLPTIFIFIL